MICATCGRGGAHFGFSPAKAPGVMACSLPCLEVHVKAHTDGRPFFPDEEAAILEGGRSGGAYLESIGKTDLATMTREEWLTFLKTVEAARSAALRAAIPF